ncbi:MAG: ATP-binding protein [Thermodesulfobacteriota bacterium]|nr:ATP-binding protein [Thermodesulfobacteriota bacterium]
MFHFRNFSPIAALLIFGSGAVILWQNQNRNEKELVFRHTQTSLEQIRIRVEGLMNARMASLKLLADRWVERTPPDFSQKRFLEFAENFYTHYPGFAGINWIDPGGGVRWVFPKEGNEGFIGNIFSEHVNSRVRDTFQKAGKNLQYVATPCTELIQRGLGFHTFWPLIYTGRVQGYLNGVFRVKRIMGICLAKSILKNFWIRLYEADRLIYTNEEQSHSNPKKDNLHVFEEIHFPGKTWQLELSPKSSLYPPRVVRNPGLLAFGLVISAILSLLLHFLNHRMQMYRRARDRALHEVSERKRAQKALKKNEKKLEALLTELAAKNAELETFVFSVSHDLKTPIVTIEGFVGALREDFGNLIPEDGEKYLNYIGDATRKMELLINDLLELSRIGRLTVKKTEFPFADVIEEAITALQPQIKKRGVQVAVTQDLPLVYGEKKRLVQVMENLLSNAIKYIGKENPCPRIEVGAQEQDDQKVIFVRDNGIGIEKIYFEKIFQVFQRLPSAKKLEQGTGVGLAIVKRVIQYHGGRVWLESEPGKGATFFFTLKDKEA